MLQIYRMFYTTDMFASPIFLGEQFSVDRIRCLWLGLCKETFLDAMALIDESPQILTSHIHMKQSFFPKSLACLLNILTIKVKFLSPNGQA